MTAPLVPLFGVVTALQSLDLGQQVFMGLILLLVAWYVFRASRVGSAAVTALSRFQTVALGVLVVGAGLVMLGWVSPRPGRMLVEAPRLALEAGRFAWSVVLDVLAVLREVIL
jgi:hypothetical protein